MAGHADNALGRKHHRGRANRIAFGMADAARRLFCRLMHLMNGTDAIRISGFVPSEVSAAGVPRRTDGVKMTGTARHASMSVMGCFFIMGPVTLFAITHRLVAVAKFRAPGMADHAGNIRMGG